MEHIAVSVIIPVYNLASYLAKCINSVCNQTLREIEIILINDGSVDSSLNVCKEFAARDHRIHVIDKSNEGTSFARRDGLNLSKGEYVFFMDCDDWIEPDALEFLYKEAKRLKLDQMVGSIKRHYGIFSKTIPLSSEVTRNQTISQTDLFSQYYISYFGLSRLPVSIWGRLYSRRLIETAQQAGEKLFDSKFQLLCGDEYFNLLLHPYTKSLYVSDKIVYNYRYGGMSCHFDPHLKEVFDLSDFRVKMLDRYNYTQGYKWLYLEYKNVFYSNITQYIEYRNISKEVLFNLIRSELETRYTVKRMRYYFQVQDISPELRYTLDGDLESIYKVAMEKVRKNRYKLMVKKCVAKMQGGYGKFSKSIK